MKKYAYSALALLLCLMLSVTALAEGVFVLPAEISAIRDEAFLGDTSMKEAVVPDGAKVIGERAFAYSALTSVTLPASLEQIADNAFEGCEGLVATVSRDSYAHQYCMDNGINYRLLEELYSIAGLMCEGANFRVTATTDEICVLRVEVMKEDRKTVLHTVHSSMEEGLDYADVLVPVPAEVTFPTYYVLRATLLDGEGNQLCEPFWTLQYTEAYSKFESETIEDYADTENEVIDFGDCGFGVVADGAIPIPGTSHTDDHKTFVIPSGTVPEKGDVIVVTLPDGTQEPVKVKTVVDNGDGTATVARDPETVLSDLYKVFKLDGVADVGAAAQNGGVTKMRAGDGSGSASLSSGFTYGVLSVNVTGTAGVTVKAFYDAKRFGEDYIEQQIYINLSVTATAKLSKAFKSSDIKDAFGNPVIPEFVLYEGPIALIGAGPAVTSLDLKISFPLEFSFEGAGEITLTITQKTGYSYTSTNGVTAIKERDADQDIKVEGTFNIQFGPKISLKANVLLGILQGDVSGQVGLRIQGKAVPRQPIDIGAPDSTVHGCILCCDIDLSFFADVKGNIVLKITKNIQHNLLDVTLFTVDASLGKAYVSIKNDEDSLFGGKLTFDFGKCPNYKYRVTVNTMNLEGLPVSGIPVKVKAGSTEKGSGISPYKLFLYDGDYNASAEFDTGTYDLDFTVLRSAREVTVSEHKLIVSGNVMDGATMEPVAAAQVTATLSDGNTVAATTASDGCYAMVLNHVDSFGLLITADGYKNWTTTIETNGRQEINVDAQMIRKTYTVTFHPESGSGTMAPLTVPGGAAFTLPSCSFTPPENMKFSAWSIGDETYAPGATYTSPAGDVDVYAQWEKKKIPDDVVFYNGHAYKFYPVTDTWNTADTLCTAMGGHLVTITSEGEQDFVCSYASSSGLKGYLWIGCLRPWTEWVTGEPLSYTNWGKGEPDGRSDQYFGCMLFNDEYRDTFYHILPGQWDDWQGPRTYYMCEWDSVDLRQISFDLNGIAGTVGGIQTISGHSVSLPIPTREGYSFVGWNTSADGSGETITSSTAISSDMRLYAQWTEVGETVPEGTICYNGSHYKLYDEYYTWNEAAAQCERLGGHLLTITDADEQAFVAGYLAENGTRNVYWMGANCESGTDWKWVTGESFDYFPNEYAVDYWGSAPYAMGLMDIEMFGPTGTWGDFEYQGYITNDTNYVIRYPEQFGYICEWDS